MGGVLLLFQLSIYCLLAPNSLFIAQSLMKIVLLNVFPLSVGMKLSIVSRGHWRDIAREGFCFPVLQMLERAWLLQGPAPAACTAGYSSTRLLQCMAARSTQQPAAFPNTPPRVFCASMTPVRHRCLSNFPQQPRE